MLNDVIRCNGDAVAYDDKLNEFLPVKALVCVCDEEQQSVFSRGGCGRGREKS